MGRLQESTDDWSDDFDYDGPSFETQILNFILNYGNIFFLDGPSMDGPDSWAYNDTRELRYNVVLQRLRNILRMIGRDQADYGFILELMKKSKPLHKVIKRFFSNDQQATASRFLFLKNCQLAWSGSDAREGDKVVWMEGYHLPMVLRRVGTDDEGRATYSLRGTAFVPWTGNKHETSTTDFCIV
jgi:hypothetical protein